MAATEGLEGLMADEPKAADLVALLRAMKGLFPYAKVVNRPYDDGRG